MRISYLGHSCLLVEVGPTTLLLDPGSFADILADPEARPAAAMNPTAVLVTHAHPDHVDPPTVAALVAANGTMVHAEAGAAELLVKADVAPHVLAPGETLQLGEDPTGTVEVDAVGGEHAVIHPDVPRVGNIGLLVRAEGRTLFHPGDSYGVVPEGVDVLAVPLNAPWTSVRETVEFVRAVAPGTVVPIHDGLLRPERREIYLGHVRRLGGAPVHDLATDGPLTLTPA